MPGLLGRSIDRELGSDRGAAPAGRRESWLRDWPLLLGLVLSAALVAASTTVSGSHQRPEAMLGGSTKAAAAGAVPGAVVDVGQAERAAPARPVARKRAAKSSAGAAKPVARRARARSAPTAETAATAPAAGSGAPRKTTRPSSGTTGGVATPGKIVNVTGTSAAFSNGPLSYAFSAPTHTPTVGGKWRLKIAAERSGAPLKGTVKIDILHNGAVVGHAASGRLSGGRYAHDFDWPERSVGYPLTVKTTVIGGGFQQSFLFAVKIKSAG